MAMPTLDDKLVVAISSRALFDFEQENQVFESGDAAGYMRLQLERQGKNFFPTVDEYSRYFCLTERAVGGAKPDVVILHPGPMNRGVEISSDVADGPYSVIMDQVTNGIAVRMAVLERVMAGNKTDGATAH